MKHISMAFRSLIVVVTLLSLCFSLVPLPAAQAAPAVSRINWSPCYQQFGPYECGTLQVPLDYDNPGAAAISLALIRLRATDPAHRIGSLFLNPGGPGGSGVDLVLFAGQFLYTPEVRARFDVVGFDPRGISRSTALRCFGTPKQWEPYFTTFAFPMTMEEADAWEQADRYVDDACAQRGTKIIDYMSTGNVARDLDLMRQAVGDELLTYAGYSYGTFIGQAYANMFPNNFRALVIDGVLDPIAWTTGEPGQEALPFSTRLHSDMGALATLTEFFRLCDANPATCAFAGPTPTAERYDALAERLKANPLVFPQPDGSVATFGYSNLVGNTLGAMYDSFSWPSFAEFLAVLDQLAAPATLAAKLQAFQVEAGLITKRGFPQYPNYIEGFPAVACADSDNPDSYSAWWQAGIAADAQFRYFGRLWTWVSSICAAWPGGNNGRYMGPFTAQTANPVLVVGNLYDPATRYQGAQKAAALLPNSRLITLNGWGHVSVALSACMDQYVSDYLLSGALPPVGTVCNQDLVPFVDITAAAASGQAAEMRANLNAITLPDAVKNKHK